MPGFVSYAAFRSGADSGMTVTVCQDKAGTDESSRRAAEWVKENVSHGQPAYDHRGQHRASVQLVGVFPARPAREEWAIVPTTPAPAL